MVRLLTDENFDNDLLRSVLRRLPACDIVRVQDVGLSGADDPSVLAWAARERRIVLTHDLATLPDDAYARVDAALPMSGVFATGYAALIGRIIDDVVLLAAYSNEGEWEGRVLYLPL